MSRNCESTCTHSLELEFVNDKFREVLTHNNVLKEQLNSKMFQDSVSVKYLKMCEDLTKVGRRFSCNCNYFIVIQFLGAQ